MPISVTCPECAYRFHVDAAFAGRPGRCPECDAVIQVPAATAFDDAYAEPGGLAEFPSASRRRAVEPPALRPADEDAAPGNPGPRIEKWRRVAAGYRNLAIAAGLVAIDTAIRGGFNLANGVNLEENPQFTSAQKALMVGNGLFSALAIILWAVGRFGLGKTPYLPARGAAMSSGVMAGLAAVPGILGVLLAAAGILLAAENPVGALAMINFGGCGICLFGLGWAVAEIVGLIAQIRMAKGLDAPGAATWAKTQLTTLVVLMVVGFTGFCVLVMVLAGEMKRQDDARKQANVPMPPPGKNAPANNANNANNNQPPPLDLEEHKDTITALIVAFTVTTIAFALLCVVSFLASMKAVRREILRLSGGPDGDPDDWHGRATAY